MKKTTTLLFLALAATSASCSKKECGAGTTEADGTCVPDVACGTGTSAQNGKCVPTGGTLTCGNGTMASNGMCIPTGGNVTCGSGTMAMNGTCVADVVCGSGTTAMNGMCVPDGATVTCGSGTTAMNGMCVSDVVCGAGTSPVNGECIANPDPPGVYAQIEHLGRPGINEALLISDAFHSGYNATAPTFAGVPAPVLTAVVGEAKTVLKALYLGACLLNGTIPGITAATGVHPAGLTCHAIGPAIWTENSLSGVTLTAASNNAAQAYADAVFGLFEPDVLRIDTGVTSSYETLCGGTSPVGLCGGRALRDDTIDVTYDFLLNGAGTCGGGLCGAPNQVNALVSDGVSFDNANAGNNVSQRVNGVATNRQQGHPNVTDTFPYSAAPI